MATVNEFATRLAKMRMELLALKTAHQRGLGVIGFSSGSATPASASSNGRYDVTVNFSSGNIFPPILRLGTTVGNVFNPAWDTSNLRFTAEIQDENYGYYDLPTITAVASAPISSVIITPRGS